jgi:lipoprotein-anchoring transpeptidase ErfK/SrfK
MNPSLLRWTLLAFALSLLSGCSTMNTVSDMVVSNIPTMHDGKASIVIRLSEQKAYLLQGGEEVAVARVSTGREGYATPTGRFKVIRKHQDHRSSLYGDYVDDDGEVVKANVDVRKHARPPGSHYRGAPMPYFVEFSPSYGLHAGHLPGRPASHGCVRLSYWKARQFFHASRLGTPVTVKQ